MGSSTVEQLDGEQDGGSTPPPYTQGVRCKRPHAESNAFRGPGSTPGAPEKKLFIIGRRDLPPGLRAAQMFHALTSFILGKPKETGEWFAKSNNLVLLEVQNKNTLKNLLAHLISKKIPVTSFCEPDLNNELTAIAVGPEGQRTLSSIPLAFKIGKTE